MSLVFENSVWLLAQDPAPGNPWGMLLPFLFIGLLFYFIMIRPDKKKRNNVAQMQANLKKNDKIVTIGGIVGVVLQASKDADEVTIRIDENSNAKMRVIRSAISRVVSDDDDGKESK